MSRRDETEARAAAVVGDADVGLSEHGQTEDRCYCCLFRVRLCTAPGKIPDCNKGCKIMLD